MRIFVILFSFCIIPLSAKATLVTEELFPEGIEKSCRYYSELYKGASALHKQNKREPLFKSLKDFYGELYHHFKNWQKNAESLKEILKAGACTDIEVNFAAMKFNVLHSLLNRNAARRKQLEGAIGQVTREKYLGYLHFIQWDLEFQYGAIGCALLKKMGIPSPFFDRIDYKLTYTYYPTEHYKLPGVIKSLSVLRSNVHNEYDRGGELSQEKLLLYNSLMTYLENSSFPRASTREAEAFGFDLRQRPPYEFHGVLAFEGLFESLAPEMKSSKNSIVSKAEESVRLLTHYRELIFSLGVKEVLPYFNELIERRGEQLQGIEQLKLPMPLLNLGGKVREIQRRLANSQTPRSPAKHKGGKQSPDIAPARKSGGVVLEKVRDFDQKAEKAEEERQRTPTSSPKASPTGQNTTLLMAGLRPVSSSSSSPKRHYGGPSRADEESYLSSKTTPRAVPPKVREKPTRSKSFTGLSKIKLSSQQKQRRDSLMAVRSPRPKEVSALSTQNPQSIMSQKKGPSRQSSVRFEPQNGASSSAAASPSNAATSPQAFKIPSLNLNKVEPNISPRGGGDANYIEKPENIWTARTSARAQPSAPRGKRLAREESPRKSPRSPRRLLKLLQHATTSSKEAD